VLTELVRPPRRIDWIDKDTIIYSAQEDPALYEQELKRKKDDSEVVDDAEPASRRCASTKSAIKDKKITAADEQYDWIGNWSISKDGKIRLPQIMKRACISRSIRKFPPVTCCLLERMGAEKAIFTEGRVQPRGFEWLPGQFRFLRLAPFSTIRNF